MVRTISAIIWTGALLRSTGARRRNATRCTPHSKVTDTSTRTLHNSQPPRTSSPRTTNASTANTKYVMHSPCSCWYNLAPYSKYLYINLLTAGPLAYCGRNWSMLKNDSWILQSIQGYHLSEINRRGNSQVAHQAGCGQGSVDRGRVREPNLLGSQKGQNTEASNQLETSQLLHSEATLQHGGDTRSEGPVAKRRLDGLCRSQRCLSVSADLEGIQEIRPLCSAP